LPLIAMLRGVRCHSASYAKSVCYGNDFFNMVELV